jgi:two-component system, NtrC family, sensor kinase
VFGAGEARGPEVVRVVGPGKVDASIERTIPSTPLAGLSLTGGNEDSVILAVPDPRAAAPEHLRVIYRVTTLLTTRMLDGQELLKTLLDVVFAEFKPQRGCIMLSGATAGAAPTPAVVKYREPPVDPEEAKIHVSRTILNHCLDRGEGVLSSNAMNDPRFASGDSVQRMHIRSAICSPIRFRERTYGAIYIDSSMANYTFTADQLALLNAIGQHAGLALANAELMKHNLQAERLAAIGETVAQLSHSIKNILQGLRGGADVVEMGLNKSDLKLARGGWAIVQRNLSRIISLTMNMLAFSRQRRVEVDLVRLAPLIDECVQLLEGACASRQVAMVADVDAEMPPVPLDAPLIHQALMNLLSNAVEAVQAGEGIVTIKAHYRAGTPTRGGEVEIAVIDNGPGIPASKQAWIFEPFNTTKGLKGTGLGLAVAKRVAEEHGGRIVLESEEGKGAMFRIIIPADATRVADPSATSASRQHPPPALG